MNQGNSRKSTNSSLPPRKSQNPCREMLVTSASPVLAPTLFDLVMSFLQDSEDPADLALRNTVILRQFDARLKPDLRFALGRLDVNMNSVLFAGVEIEPERSFAKHRWAHAWIVHEQAGSTLRGVSLAHGAALSRARQPATPG